MKPPKTIHSLNTNGFTWTNVTKAAEEETLYLEKTHHFHPLDIKECLPPLQRPKLIPRGDYLFLILTFPIFNRKTREIEPEEIDIFIKKDAVITAHSNKMQALQNFFDVLELDKVHRANLMSNPAYFLSQLLDVLFEACFPMLVHISNDIEAVSKQVLKGYTKETIHEILRLKNSIVSFRKAMHPHKNLMTRLQALLPTIFPIEGQTHYFNRLVDQTKEIWDNLETYSYAVDSLHQTHATLISFRLNQILKTLTVFSVLIYLLTFISNLFIIPAVDVPIIGYYQDFWIIIGLMVGISIIVLAIFKKKKWL